MFVWWVYTFPVHMLCVSAVSCRCALCVVPTCLLGVCLVRWMLHNVFPQRVVFFWDGENVHNADE